jgi:DNA-binding CsgD family transcriptional regulator
MLTEEQWAKTLVKLGSLPTITAVSQFLKDKTADMGFPIHVIAPIPTEQNPVSDGLFLVQNWPTEWDETYRERGFAAFDPVPVVAPLLTKPVSIDDVYAGRAGFIPDPRSAEIRAFACSFGCPQGVLVPIFGPLGYRAIVCFAGPGPVPGPEGLALLQVLAHFAHDRVRELAAKTHKAPVLSNREIEVLRCLHDGMSDTAAAEQLGVTVRTIRFHFTKIRQKLDAKNRGQAVAMAVHAGTL